MTTASDEALSPADRIYDLVRIEAALRKAVRTALSQHKRAGNPIAVWRDGHVVWVQPADIPDDGDDLTK